MPDLLVKCDDFKQYPRRRAAALDNYPHGTGVDEFKAYSSEGNVPVSDPSIVDYVSKWPGFDDYRSGGYMPGGIGVLSPSPSCIVGTFQCLPPSPEPEFEWPNPLDCGKTVYWFPDENPSAPTETIVYRAQGLLGGSARIECTYSRPDVENPGQQLGYRHRYVFTIVDKEFGQLEFFDDYTDPLGIGQVGQQTRWFPTFGFDRPFF